MRNLIKLFVSLFTLLSLSAIGTIICFTAYAETSEYRLPSDEKTPTRHFLLNRKRTTRKKIKRSSLRRRQEGEQGKLSRKRKRQQEIEERQLLSASKQLLSASKQLLSAVKSGDIQKVNKILSKKRVDLSIPGIDGRTALHWAAAEGYEGLVRSFLRRGAPLIIPDNKGRTPLDLAAKRGHERVVDILLKHGAAASGGNSCAAAIIGFI